MGNIELNQERINEILFIFLKSVYLFEKREATLFNVTWDEVYLLQLLARKNPMTVSELAKNLKIKNFTASRMITRLAEQNLVLRKQSTEDKRSVEVFITAEGLNKIREIEDFNYKTILANIDTLGENEVQALIKSIENLDILLGVKE
ncbi:MAG: MarR family transcriptional regulator [Syntrophomonadaceae bacterium]|nr:MarR family transcriptional regulator [Syntrophomonadaceae bacterium]